MAANGESNAYNLHLENIARKINVLRIYTRVWIDFIVISMSNTLEIVESM
jgi:hypothetical protein